MAGLFDFLNNVPKQSNQNSQPSPVPWNTRTPMPTSSPSPSDGSNWNTRIPFTPSPQQNNTQPAPQQSDPSSSPSSGGFFSNLMNRYGHDDGISNLFHDSIHGIGNVAGSAIGLLGGKIDQFEKFTGLNKVSGAAKNLINTAGQLNNPNYDKMTPAEQELSRPRAGDLWNAIVQGFNNPDQGNQNFQQGLQTAATAGNWSPLQKSLTNLIVSTGTDPLSYVPVGSIAKALGTGIKTASDATKLTPIVNSASNAFRKASVIKPAIDNTSDLLGRLFSKGYGTSADTLPTMNALHGNMSADQYAIQQKMAELAQAHNLKPSQFEDLAHHIDGRPTMDPQVQQSAQQLKDILSGGFQSQHGKVYGTDAELRNSHISPAPSLQNILNGDAGSSIRQGAVENYYPRRFNNTPDEVKAALDQYNTTQKGLSTNGIFNKAREFPTLQDAIDHGLKPEMNPYVAIGQRLGETSKSIRNDEAIKQLLYSGVVDKTPAVGKAESTIKPFDPHVINVPDPSGGTKGLLQKYFMNPEDQSAIKQSIDPTKRDSGYDKLVNLWKQITLMNPAVHGHNIAYNGMYLGGAKPAYVAEHMGNLMKGTSDPWFERALASGAVSSDTLGKSSFSEALSKALSPDDRSAFSKAMGGVGYAAHGSLWDADKAMRTSIFRDAVEKGATDTEAADKANKYLVNYNNTTPFENSVMKRIFPFYSWMKGNLPLQAEQMINNTPKQLFAQNATNAASQAISGEDAKGGKVGSGQVLPDGSEVKIDPYMPSSEPGKVMDQGPLAFLYGKSNPILKEILSQVLNKAYYPSSSLAPTGKESMADAAITNPEAPGGYNALKRGVHAANSVLPISGVAGSLASGLLGGTDSRGALNNLVGLPNKDKPPTTSLELITKALGGFSSRSNPAQDAKNAQYGQKDSILNHIKYEKEVGIPVSKSEKKAAYRKIR